jgi:hypothetical protein
VRAYSYWPMSFPESRRKRAHLSSVGEKAPSPAVETVYACLKLLNKTFTEAKSRIVLSPLD